MVPWRIAAGIIVLFVGLASGSVAEAMDLRIVFLGQDMTVMVLSSVMSVVGGHCILKGVIGGRR